MRTGPVAISIAIALQIGLAQQTADETQVAHISGFSDIAQDKAGKIDRIDVMVRLEVQLRGTYRLSLQPKSVHGRTLTGYATKVIEKGLGAITASFNAKAIKDYLNEDGPYRISDVRLLREGQNGADNVDSREELGSTAAYRLADLWQEPPDAYFFTGEIDAEGSDPTPAGKFRKLKVRFGVQTPGGQCWWWGALKDESGSQLDFKNGSPSGPLPSGKTMLVLNFESFNIARRTQDGPLFLSDVTLTCGGKGVQAGAQITNPTKLRTPSFRSSAFENPDADFEFVVRKTPILVAAGDTVSADIDLHSVGGMDLLVDRAIVTAQTVEAKLRFEMFGSQPCSTSVSCIEGQWSGLSIDTPPDLASGTYTIRLSARAAGKEHAATLELIVDPELTRRKQLRDSALAALLREDPAPTPPPSVSPSTPSPDLPRGFPFTAGVSLRKIHAVLVLDRSSSMNNRDSCRFLRAAATRFANMFVDGRDWLGVVSFSDNAELILSLTDHFQSDAGDRISKIACAGNTNTGAALEMARQELVLHEDPEAMNAVILFTDGQPNMLTAKWPLRKIASDAICSEARGIEELPATLRTDNHGSQISFRQHSCFTQIINADSFSYIPETDINGIALNGNHTLERLRVGPNRGKIRMDSMDNIIAALANEVENAAQQLRSGANPAFIHVIGFRNTVPEALLPLSYLTHVANDPQSPVFDRKQPAGTTILTATPEEFWPSFLRVREAIVRQAAIH